MSLTSIEKLMSLGVKNTGSGTVSTEQPVSAMPGAPWSCSPSRIPILFILENVILPPSSIFLFFKVVKMTTTPPPFYISLSILLTTAWVVGMGAWKAGDLGPTISSVWKSYHRPCTWVWRAGLYIDYLLETHSETHRGNKWMVFRYLSLVSLTVPLTETGKSLAGN